MNRRLSSKILFKLILFMGISLSCRLSAQPKEAIQIHKITVDESGFLNLWVKKSTDGDVFNQTLDADYIKIYEKINLKADSIKVVTNSIRDTLKLGEDTLGISTVHFLVDVSNKVTNEELKRTEEIIKKIISENNQINQNNIDFYLHTFSDKKSKPTEITNINNISNLLSKPEFRNNKPPDFFRIYIETIKSLKHESKGKVLCIIGSGENSDVNPIYKKQLPYDKDDIEKFIENIPENLRVYAINLKPDGSGASFDKIRDLVKSADYYISSHSDSLNYSDILKNNDRILSNFLVQITSKSDVFKGEKRSYIARLNSNAEGERTFEMGSVFFPRWLKQSISWSDWLLPFLMGILVLGLLLIIGISVIPFIRERDFKKQYVYPYIQEKNIRRNDPYYNEPINGGDLIVNKCNQIIPFTTWKEIGWQCPNYPDCMNQNCSGAGAPEANDFFSMKGIYLKLNWILFGTAGGFLAWLFVSLFILLDFQWINKTIEKLVIQQTNLENPWLIAQNIGNSLLIGIACGTGLTLMLSLMEERRSSNQYSRWDSFYKILRRTIAGILISSIAFTVGAYLQYKIGLFYSGLSAWILFGIGLGSILSYQSSITTLNGIGGGLLASILSFIIFWTISSFPDSNFLTANLFSMLVLGGVMGAIVVTVVTMLEDYELEIIAPIGFQRTIPISKWLKSDIGVTIGKSPKNYIFVKWDDHEVKPKHAELFAEGGKIFIRPIDEVLLNSKIINKPVRLTNGDVFQLGRSSITQFQYVEKQLL